MYLSNVPWNWIKQRPNFIAEELGKHFDVDIFVEKSYRHGNMAKNATDGVHLQEIFRFPFVRLECIRRLKFYLVFI